MGNMPHLAAAMTGEVAPIRWWADDVREILAYATARHIDVLPEIELPGRSALDGSFSTRLSMFFQADEVASLPPDCARCQLRSARR